MSDVIKKGGPIYVGSYMREQALENRIKELESKLSSACTRATDFENDFRAYKARMHDAFNVAEGLRAAITAERERADRAEADLLHAKKRLTLELDCTFSLVGRLKKAEAELAEVRAAHDAMVNEAQRMARERDALRADAERYRFLCSLDTDQWREFGEFPDNEIDAAIDAAREGRG